MDKKFIQIFFAAFTIFLLQSCCTKKACSGPYFMMEFYNFDEKEIDTVIVQQYRKESQFAILLRTDTFTSYKSYGVDYFYAVLETVNADNDFIVTVPGAGLNYTLSELATKRVKCNGCFPFTPRSEFYRSLHEYKLNGQPNNTFPLKIYK